MQKKGPVEKLGRSDRAKTEIMMSGSIPMKTPPGAGPDEEWQGLVSNKTALGSRRERQRRAQQYHRVPLREHKVNEREHKISAATHNAARAEYDRSAALV